MIVAKFKCVSVEKFEGGLEQAKLQAAYGKGNESWATATPSGNISISISNRAAQGFLLPGYHYFITFEDAGPDK